MISQTSKDDDAPHTHLGHQWTVWERIEPLLVGDDLDQNEAAALLMDNKLRRYAMCSCGGRLSVSDW